MVNLETTEGLVVPVKADLTDKIWILVDKSTSSLDILTTDYADIESDYQNSMFETHHLITTTFAKLFDIKTP